MSTDNPDMKLERDEETLTAYLDGELGADERELFEAAVADSPEMQAEVARLQKLGAMMRASTPALEGAIEATGERGSADALFARIEGSLESLGSEQAAPTPAVEPSRPQLRVIEGGGKRRVAAIVVAVAAAAAVALVASKGLAPEAPIAEGPQPERPSSPSLGSEVLEVDFGKSTGTIFNVEGEQGQPLAVVWIDDPEELYGPLPIDGLDKDSEEVTQ